jgi:predicted permease
MSHLKNSFRQLVRRPGLSGVVIVLLALGIGATTAIFSLFHQVLVQPLPVAEPEGLVNLGAPGPKRGSTSCSNAGNCEQIFAYPMFRDLEKQQSVFEGIAAHRDFNANLSYEGQTAIGRGILVSSSYFRMLGLRAAAGRLIGPEDEPRVDESPVVVLSHDYWRSQFGADPAVVGRALTVNGQRLTVIGVAEEGFAGTILGFRPQVFVPITLRWLMEPTRPRDENDRFAYWVYLFARLKSGVSLEEASAGINVLYGGILNDVEAPLQSALDADILDEFLKRRITLEPGARGQSQLPDNAGQPLMLLLGITALVLLIVCVNIANLLLARGLSRAGEMAIRASIGASRRRLVAQLMVETGVLAVIGGVLSVPVAAVMLRAIAAIVPGQLAAGLAMELSTTALVFLAAASLATVLFFGLAPAMQATHTDLGAVAKGQAPQALGGHGMTRVRTALATAQIAFSMVLLVLAGLFALSLANIARVALGMDVDSIATFTVSPRASGYTAESTMAAFDRLEERLAAEPGVVSVGTSAIALLTGREWGLLPRFEGFDGVWGVDNRVLGNEVSPDFFRTLAIPLLAGRGFTSSDVLDSPRVAIVNERFARQFNLGNDAIGQRFALGQRDVEIVGVIADAKYSDVKDDVPPQLFFPRRQDDNLGALTFYVRGGIDSGALLRMIPRVVADIDPNLPVIGLMTMARQAQDNVFLDRLVAMLAASFAGLATLVASIGLYGVLAYNVARRTRELGLRLALGAQPRRLRSMVLKQVGIMALIGGAIGLALAVGLGRLAEALLFGLSGYDLRVLIGATTVLSAVVLAASWLPARRASNVTPMEALRYE